jgi:hypothetical protein
VGGKRGMIEEMGVERRDACEVMKGGEAYLME